MNDHFRFSLAIFAAETSDLTAEHAGVYVRLLCHQWTHGAIPADMERLARIAGAAVDEAMLAKFERGEDGRLRAYWLEGERKKQVALSQKRRRAGQLRRSGQSQSSKCSANAQQMLESCLCGCGRPVHPGRKFASRGCANRLHGREVFAGKPKENLHQEKCGRGTAPEGGRYHGGAYGN